MQVQPRDEVHIFLMVVTLSVLAYITAIKEMWDGGAFIGSHLLGAFVAGVCFVNVPRSQQIWNNQMKRVVKWMVRCFSPPLVEMYPLPNHSGVPPPARCASSPLTSWWCTPPS